MFGSKLRIVNSIKHPRILNRPVRKFSTFTVKFPQVTIVRVPCFEESFGIKTGEVSEWLKNIGDECKKDEIVCKFTTLKATVEIGATTSGKLITQCLPVLKEVEFDNKDITSQPALFVLEKLI